MAQKQTLVRMEQAGVEHEGRGGEEGKEGWKERRGWGGGVK